MDIEKHCLFCNSRNLIIKESKFAPFVEERMFFSNKKQTSLVLCKNCGICYSSYRPNDEEMARLYANYRDEDYQKQRQKHEPHYTKEFNASLGHSETEINRRNKLLEKFICKYIKTNEITSVLDWGGDSGQYIPKCFKNASKYVYDISKVPVIEDIINIDNEDQIKNKQFDFVMCCHVLEHVSYPINITNKLVEYCKDGGYLYIEVPDEDINIYYNIGFHEHITRYSINTLLEFIRIYSNLNLISIENGGRIAVLLKKEKITGIKRAKKYYLNKMKFKFILFMKLWIIFYKKIITFLNLI